MTDIADILAQAENPAYVRVAVARILLRQDLLGRHAELDAELQKVTADDAMHNRVSRAPQLAAEILALEQEMESAKTEFRFKAIGYRAWADLMGEYPPTREQKAADKRIDHNPETFPFAAIAASCVDPVMTFEQAQRLGDHMTVQQFTQWWGKCIEANVGGADPKSLAAGVIHRANGQYASTPAPAASPDPSSSVEL